MSEWHEKQARWESFREKRPELSDHTRALWEVDRARTLTTARAILASAPGLVVDVGTGHTDLGRDLAERATGYLAIDPTPGREDEQLERCWLLAGMGEALPLRDGCARLIMLRASLDHMEDDVGALREARRVLAPHGRILVTLSNRRALLNHLRRLRSLIRRRPVYQHLDQHLRYYSLEDLRKVARAADLRVLSCESYLYLPRSSLVSRIEARAPWVFSGPARVLDPLLARGDVFLAVLGAGSQA